MRNATTSTLAIGLLVLGLAGCGVDTAHTAHQSGGADISGSVADGLLTSSTDAGCSADQPHRVGMATAGEPITDLYLCTSDDQTWTSVVNVSHNKVWYLTSPAGVTEGGVEETVGNPGRVGLFRAALWARFGRAPLQTVEPGTTIYLDAAPSQVALHRDPGEEGVWMTETLLVGTADDTGADLLSSLLAHGSPAWNAAVKCGKVGYDALDSLTSTDEASSDLESALGLYDDAGECSAALEEARREAASESTVLTTDDLAEHIRVTTWELRTSRVAELAHDLPRAIHIP